MCGALFYYTNRVFQMTIASIGLRIREIGGEGKMMLWGGKVNFHQKPPPRAWMLWRDDGFMGGQPTSFAKSSPSDYLIRLRGFLTSQECDQPAPKPARHGLITYRWCFRGLRSGRKTAAAVAMAAATRTVGPMPTVTFSGGRQGPCLGSSCYLSRLLTHVGRLLPRRGDAARGVRGVRVRGRVPQFSLHIPRATQSGVEEGGGEGRRQEEAEEGDCPLFSVLTSIRSQYNEIVVVDTPTSRVLLLDSTHNVHSILNKGQILTNSYWDEFATLPAIIPRGPIAILGLGGGTAAHLILNLWPSLHLVGWEIDAILIDKAREYFGLSDLENHNHAGGFLSINVGDALSASMSVPGGFAGIIVDLFSDGKVLPQLQEVNTWLELEKRLMPHGRIMVNCGGSHSETSYCSGVVNTEFSKDDTWVKNSTIKALCVAFSGKLSWKRMAEKDSENYMALTGHIPDIESWSASVPGQLVSNVKHWKPCGLA